MQGARAHLRDNNIMSEYQLKPGKIGTKVTGAYQKIEDGVVGTYKMEGKEPVKVNGKTVGCIILSVFGALLFGIGMCLSMVFGKMILGIVIGLVGIITLLMLISLTVGLK